MIKQAVFILFSIMAGDAICLLTLYALSDRKNAQNNGFNRNLVATVLSIDGIFHDEGHSWYFAGRAGRDCYFGNYKAGQLLQATETLEGRTVHNPDCLQKATVHAVPPRVLIDSPECYVFEEAAKSIFSVALDSGTILHRWDNISFTGAVPVAGHCLVRSYDPVRHQNDLFLAAESGVVRKNITPILSRQVDGFFCTDGMLLQTKGRDAGALYIYFYRNQMLALDSAGTLKHRWQTIDTTMHAKVSVSENINWQAISSPEWIVNKAACIDGNHLFVYSTLRADNEIQKTFDRNAVVDIYQLQTGKYLYSFYVPDYHRQKMAAFAVTNQTLLAFYRDDIVSYRLGFASN